MSLLFALKGRQGDQGDKGDEGDKGDKGDKGDQGDPGVGFVDRGNRDAQDYHSSTLIIDAAWHDLDLHTIVGSNAALILLRIRVVDNGIGGQHIKFRTKGVTGDFNVSKCTHSAVNITCTADCWVVCDSDGVIQYNMSASLDGCYITIGGWVVL